MRARLLTEFRCATIPLSCKNMAAFLEIPAKRSRFWRIAKGAFRSIGFFFSVHKLLKSQQMRPPSELTTTTPRFEISRIFRQVTILFSLVGSARSATSSAQLLDGIGFRKVQSPILDPISRGCGRGQTFMWLQSMSIQRSPRHTNARIHSGTTTIVSRNENFRIFIFSAP